MTEAFKPYVEAMADLFYPRRCVCCDRRASDVLCRSCFEKLPRIEEPVCGRCGRPAVFETFVCEECKGLDFGFESARAPLRYEGVGEEIVHALKYRGYTWVARRLMAPLIVEVAGRGFDEVVPVPLHASRLRKRGFNQAKVMAESVAGQLNSTLSDKLQAVRRTRDQIELSGAGRRANVRGAFGAKSRVTGRVLLVDDVFTTGATMSECASVLRRAGAAEVHAVSLCRTC